MTRCIKCGEPTPGVAHEHDEDCLVAIAERYSLTDEELRAARGKNGDTRHGINRVVYALRARLALVEKAAAQVLANPDYLQELVPLSPAALRQQLRNMVEATKGARHDG